VSSCNQDGGQGSSIRWPSHRQGLPMFFGFMDDGEYSMSQNQPLLSMILRGLAVAMGVAAVVLSVLRTTDNGTLITLLGIGLFALAADGLNRDRTQ